MNDPNPDASKLDLSSGVVPVRGEAAPSPADLRLAYIISAYQNPGQLLRLVRRISAPDHWVFIHYDLRSPAAEFAVLEKNLAGLANIKLLPRHSCRWGDFGHVRATLKGLAEIARQDFACDYAILLTGQDYPLCSDAGIRRRLAAAAGRSFMEATAWPIPNWEKGRALRRISHYHVHLPVPNWLRRRGWPPSRQHLRIPMNRRVPGGLHPWFGSSYWYLHRNCLRQLWQHWQQSPGLERFFEHVLIPDECFFQTILMNSPLADSVERRTLTRVIWRPPWPGVLTLADLPELLSEDYLFARKFSWPASQPLADRLDELNGFGPLPVSGTPLL